MNANPLEKVIEGKVRKFAMGLGWKVYKFTSPMQCSVPDRIFIQGGTVLFIEFKRKGCMPTKAQAHELACINARGVPALVVDNVAMGEFIIDAFTK